MLATQKTFDMLKSIEMNKYERNLWVSILSKGSATAGELADISKVPRSRCYDVLETLADKGFIMVKNEKPLKYVAIDPSDAMERIENKIMEETQDKIKRIDSIKNDTSIKELKILFKDGMKKVNTADLHGTIKGRTSHKKHLDIMMKKSKSHIKIITTERGLDEIAENHSDRFKKLSKKGIKIKILSPKAKSESIKKLSDHVEIRQLKSEKLLKGFGGRVFMVDGKEFSIGITDDARTHPGEDLFFWSANNHMSSSMVSPVFDLMWDKGSKF